MPEVYSLAKPGMALDMLLHIRYGDPAAVMEIVAHEDFEFPNLELPRLDVTHMRSPGKVGEEINGIRDAVQFEIPMQYWPGHANNAVYRTLIDSQEVVEFLITLPSGLRGWAARVMHFDPTSIPMRDKAMAVLKLSLMAEVETPTALPTP